MNNLAKQPNRRRFQTEIDATRLPSELNEAYDVPYLRVVLIRQCPSWPLLKQYQLPAHYGASGT